MVNILLDLILVAGLRLGVAGAAIATISSQFFSACMVVYALTHTEDMYKLVWSKVRIDGADAPAYRAHRYSGWYAVGYV